MVSRDQTAGATRITPAIAFCDYGAAHALAEHEQWQVGMFQALEVQEGEEVADQHLGSDPFAVIRRAAESALVVGHGLDAGLGKIVGSTLKRAAVVVETVQSEQHGFRLLNGSKCSYA
jgi:hypothetical protein